jgi:hypothetical protein
MYDNDHDFDPGMANTAVQGGADSLNPAPGWLVPAVRQILQEELRRLFGNSGLAMNLA